MKKNILTIIILAMTLVNMVLSAVIIFTIVPTANKTNNLVSKVAQIIDLEVETEEVKPISVSDINIHEIPEKLTINLKRTNNINHYAVLNVSLSVNKVHEDAETIEPLIEVHANEIKEIVTEEFSKYAIDEVMTKKDEIKEQVLTRIQDPFHSDCIVNVSFGNMVLQ